MDAESEMVSQITQLRTALAAAADSDKPALQAMITEMETLLTLSNNLACANESSNAHGNDDQLCSKDTHEDMDEFARFQAEIAALDSRPSATQTVDGEVTNISTSTSDSKPEESSQNEKNGVEVSVPTVSEGSLLNDLSEMEGMKCLAPFQIGPHQLGYYSAMVSSVESIDANSQEDKTNSILVRVVFLQPVVKGMLLCPYFQKATCRYEDSKCNFSHGEIVPFLKLREYKEPDYSKILPGSKILAKKSDELWSEAYVSSITSDGQLCIKFTKRGDETVVIPMHESVPYYNDDEDDDENSSLDSSSDFDSSDFEEMTDFTSDDKDGLLKATASTALGQWEQYTKGIGSKLMMKMGYIIGSGLGKNSEGRIDPIDAVVLPPGRSLDRCMEIKEKAGVQNLFSVEKRMLRMQKKEEANAKILEEREKKKISSVFDFINNKLSEKSDQNQSNEPEKLKVQTSQELNKKVFGLGEDLKQVARDILKTKEAIRRNKDRDSSVCDRMKEKLSDLEKHEQELRRKEFRILNEKKMRSDKTKLLKF